jgi:hypothetical protein
MMASIDGRIDCAMTEQIGGNEYYEALEMLCIDTTIEGKTTAVNHYAEKELFVPKDATPVGKEEFYRSHDAKRWEAVVDTHGTLRWPEGDTPDRICIVSQQASCEYLDYLRRRGISYIATGEEAIDLNRAINILQYECRIVEPKSPAQFSCVCFQRTALQDFFIELCSLNNMGILNHINRFIGTKSDFLQHIE